MWKWILQLPPLRVTECFTGRFFQNLDPIPETVDGFITDFDWDSGRFVEFKSPFTRKEILSPGGNSSSHWNKNNSSVMIDNIINDDERKLKKNNYNKKSSFKLNHQDRIRV
jgi:hypothetical protein